MTRAAPTLALSNPSASPTDAIRTHQGLIRPGGGQRGRGEKLLELEWAQRGHIHILSLVGVFVLFLGRGHVPDVGVECSKVYKLKY